MTAAALGLLTIFALSGCIKMDIALNVEGDTVNGTMIVGVDREILELSGQTEEELVDQLSEDIPETEGVTTEPYEDDKFVGTKFTLDGVSLDEFNDDASSSSDDLQITHDTGAGEYTVSGVLDLSEAPGEGPGAELAESLDIKIAITFPGRVIRHNGELDGNTVTWRPKPGEKLTLEAVASDSGSSSFNWLLALGVAIPLMLLIGGVIVWLLMRGRSSGSPPGPGEPALTGYPGGASYGSSPAGPIGAAYPDGPPPTGVAPSEPQFQAGTAWTPPTATPPSPVAPPPPPPESMEPPTRPMPPVQPPGNP